MNPARGEAALEVPAGRIVLRPTFAALVAAEGEIGPLFDMVERAAAGRLAIGEIAALLWHCAAERPAGLERDDFAEAVAALGLVRLAPVLKILIGQILQGR